MLGTPSGFLSVVTINAIPTVIYLTAATSSPWTVPDDFNFVNNTIECWGAGGGGAGTQGTSNQATGGAGGTYGKRLNLFLTPGSTVSFQVGQGGAGGTSGVGANGGNTWFNGSSLASCSAGAQGGQGGTKNANGGFSGGIWVGNTGFAGGAGGNVSQRSVTAGGSGGGGAGGPHGVGARGGLENISSPVENFALGGPGGGGSDGGTIGQDKLGTGSVGANGVAGGTAHDGTAGGAGGVVSASNGSAGSHGSGGGGGGGDYYNHVSWKGGAGGTGLGYTQTSNNFVVGPGGGGGGGGGNDFNAPNLGSIHFLAQGSSGTFRDYYESANTGIPGAVTGTLSTWFKYGGTARVSSPRIFNVFNENNGLRFFLSSGSIFLTDEQTGTARFRIGSSNRVDDGNWHHITMCWDASIGATACHVYVDDIDVYDTGQDLMSTSFYASHFLNYSSTWRFNPVMNSSNVTGPAMVMDLSQFWFSSEYFDISNTTNRRKFVTSDLKEVFLGTNGQAPTGTTPDWFLGNPASTFTTNLGTGPDLTPLEATIPSDSTSPAPSNPFTALAAGAGGTGAFIGGGGGGGGRSSNATVGAVGGAGANGLIIITYNGRTGG